jgi:hypothetical protein
MTFTFNSKETYLAYRKEWFQRYQEQIKAVRAAKLGIREANRQYSKGNGWVTDIWPSYRVLYTAHKQTSDLLLELGKAREEAGRQMRLKQTA